MAKLHATTDQPATPWLRAGGAAALLHLAVIGAAIGTFKSIPAGSPAAPASFAVMLLPEPPTAPTDIPPGPSQDEAQPRITFHPKVRVPFERPPVLKIPVPAAIQVAKADDRPTPETLKTAPEAVTTTTRPPAATQQPTATPQTGQISTPMQTWESALLAQLERNKRYPSKARYYRQQDTVYIHFMLDRQGHVLSSSIAKSEHYQALDDEALSLLQRTQPLPPPPAQVTGQTVSLTVPIQFYLR